MKLWGSTARSPLFLRIFLLMLTCVAVVQLMNLALLVAAQTPEQRLYTVGEIVDVLRTGGDPSGEFEVDGGPALAPAGWNPRAERLQLALAMALSVSPERIEIRFARPFLQREAVYDRASAPPAAPPRSLAAARDTVLTGDFVVAMRQGDARWIKVAPAGEFEPWRWFALLWLLVSVVAVAPFAWALAHRIAKPIRTFAAAADRLGRDPRAEPLTVAGPAELADAAAAFNGMQARLTRYVEDRTTVMGALAHDLRTPLMRMELRLEAVPDVVRAACEHDIRDMQAMISAAVAYVRGSGELGLRRPLDLRSLAETVVDDLSDRGEPVTLAGGDPVVIEGNAAALKAMIGNLVANAIRYGGGAEVALSREGDQIVMDVVDRGPGIPPDDLEQVFEPFFRGERSRNRNTGGLGLGLASARAVARAHGGEVTIANRDGGGATARVVLPV